MVLNDEIEITEDYVKVNTKGWEKWEIKALVDEVKKIIRIRHATLDFRQKTK